MFREMRRKKQKLTTETCEEILRRGTSGVLALSGDSGYPYAVPLSYAYCGGKLFFHSAKSGHKLDAIRREQKASFCVIDADEVVPAEFTTYFRSVIAFGKIRILEDEQEKSAAIDALAVKYAPSIDPAGRQDAVRREFGSLCILEFSVEYLSGKEAIELINAKKRSDLYVPRICMSNCLYCARLYNLNADVYVVSCTMRESSFDKYAPVFEAIMDSYTITPSPSTGASANGIQVNSMDKAQMLVEDWMEAHPIGPMAGVDTGAAANDVDSISAEYFVLELWEAPREFLGLVYVRKSDGNITFKQFDFDEAISIDDWYEEWARGQSSGSAGDITLVDPQDEESWINLYKDGSFSMQVNLYAGYGTLSGTYERLDTGYKCHIEEKSYSGFPSDSIEEFELAFCDSGVKYVGEEIGTTTSESVYQLDSDLR